MCALETQIIDSEWTLPRLSWLETKWDQKIGSSYNSLVTSAGGGDSGGMVTVGFGQERPRTATSGHDEGQNRGLHLHSCGTGLDCY